jgi:hypothetical protein
MSYHHPQKHLVQLRLRRVRYSRCNHHRPYHLLPPMHHRDHNIDMQYDNIRCAIAWMILLPPNHHSQVRHHHHRPMQASRNVTP